MDLMISKMSNEISLTEFEKDIVRSFFVEKKLKKRETLLEIGETFHHLFFVEKGLLRAYLLGDHNEEHLMQFSAEGSWIPDNFHQREDIKSLYSIDALEDSEVYMIERVEFQRLMETVPKLEKYIRVVMQERLVNFHLRIINYLTHFTEEQYRVFSESHDGIEQRLPGHMIASYLGFRPETLSRTRRKIATTKKVK